MMGGETRHVDGDANFAASIPEATFRRYFERVSMSPEA